MTLEKDLQVLKRVIDELVELPATEWNYFCRFVSARKFETGGFLIHAGDRCANFFFLINGLVRFFYLTDEGKEFNKHFAMENNFVGSFQAMVLKLPYRFSVQAMSPTQTLVLPISVLEDCYDRHAAWERLGRRQAEYVAVKKEIRESEFLLDSAEKRYRQFLKEYPSLIHRIPQYHIASYLGITDVALSRIRKKMKILT